MLAKLAVLSAALILAPLAARHDDLFLNEDFETGLVNITDGDDIFYWLFRSKEAPSLDPLVLWLTGGPGCASEIALFYENGPFKIENNMTLSPNENAWNKFANLLYVD